MDKYEDAEDQELGRLVGPIHVSKVHFGTRGPAEPVSHQVQFEDKQHGILYLDFWVEPHKKLARLADFATSKFQEVCGKC